MTKWIEEHLVDRHMNVGLYDGVFICDEVANSFCGISVGCLLGFNSTGHSLIRRKRIIHEKEDTSPMCQETKERKC